MAAHKTKGVTFSIASPGSGEKEENVRWRRFLPQPASAILAAKDKDRADIATSQIRRINGPSGSTALLIAVAEPLGKHIPRTHSVYAYVFCGEDGVVLTKKQAKAWLKNTGVRRNIVILGRQRLLKLVRRELSLVAVVRFWPKRGEGSRLKFWRMTLKGADGIVVPLMSCPVVPAPPLPSGIAGTFHPFYTIRRSFVAAFPDLGTRSGDGCLHTAADITGMFVITTFGRASLTPQYALWWLSLDGSDGILLTVHDIGGEPVPDAIPLHHSMPDPAGTLRGEPYSNTAMHMLIELATQASTTVRLVGYTSKAIDGYPASGTIVGTSIRPGVRVSATDQLTLEVVREYTHDARAVGHDAHAYYATFSLKKKDPCYAGAYGNCAWALQAETGHGRESPDNLLEKIWLSARSKQDTHIERRLFTWDCLRAGVVLSEAYARPQSRYVFMMGYAATESLDLGALLFAFELKRGITYVMNVFGDSMHIDVIASFHDTGAQLLEVEYPNSDEVFDFDEELPASWHPPSDYTSCTLAKSSTQRRRDECMAASRSLFGHMRMSRADSVALGSRERPKPKQFLAPGDPLLEARSINGMRTKLAKHDADDSDEDEQSTLSSSSESRPQSSDSSLSESDSGQRSDPLSACDVDVLTSLRDYEIRTPNTASGKRRARSLSESRDCLLENRTRVLQTRRVSGSISEGYVHQTSPLATSRPVSPDSKEVPDALRPVSVFLGASDVGGAEGIDSKGRFERIIVATPKKIIVLRPTWDDIAFVTARVIDVEAHFGPTAALISARPYQDMSCRSRVPNVVAVEVAFTSEDGESFDSDGLVYL